MSLNVTFNGSMYIIPETGEVGWGGNTTSYLVAIAAGALQKTGGSFTLSADTDFGASFGLMSLYYKSRSSNIATSGILRLNNNSDAINWRNAANSANLPLLVNASNELIYNGNQVLTGTGPSNYVSSIAGTANQVNASASTGAVTLSLPQSINTSANVQFGTLGLGSSVVASSILALTSTSLGFLPPRMTTTQRDAIVSPATGLMVYNTTTNQYNIYDGSSWVALASSGGGTVAAGTQYQLGYYAANGTTISGLPLITALRAVESNANGLPVASTVTSTELGYVSGVTSAIQTQLNGKEPTITILPISKGGTNSGTALSNNRILRSSAGAIIEAAAITGNRALISDSTGIPTHSVTTDTELSYVSGVTSAIQTQLNTKATDSLVVHLAGSENITGLKTFTQTPTSSGTNTADFTANETTASILALLSANTTASYVGTTTNHAFQVRANNTAGVILNTSGAASIRGTVTNDNASAGFVGEYLESKSSTPTNFPASNTYTDAASLNITAGDWDLTLQVRALQNGATWTQALSGISTTSGNSGSGLSGGDNLTLESWASSSTTPESSFLPIIAYRVSVNSTTTYYAKIRSVYSAGTPQYQYRFSARRVR